LKIGPEPRRAIKEGRLLILSIFGSSVRRTTSAQAVERIDFVSAIADIVFIPQASVGGKTEELVYKLVGRGRAVVTFADRENTNLVQAGARMYGCGENVFQETKDSELNPL
jgi:hypothetical protein